MNWNDLLRPDVVWVLVGLLLLIAEFAIPGLVVLFFGLGALLVGMICLFVDLSLNLQIILFVVSSIGMLVLLRDSLSRIFQETGSDAEPEDAMEFVGERAKVIQAISPQARGRVEFHGSQWRAESAAAVPEGATVEVVGRDNLTLLVRPLESAST